MGEIPLLTRDQEINLAKRIEITRRKFRRKVLECDYALRLVVDVLKKVDSGELPFDRTVKVSVTENLEKEQILQRMKPNLATLDHLMDCNVRDFRSYIRAKDDPDAARALRDRAGPPPPQGRHPGRGALDPDPEGPAADEAARADRRPDERAPRASGPRSRPAGATRKTWPTSRRS